MTIAPDIFDEYFTNHYLTPRKENTLTEPEFKEGDLVTAVTKSWGHLPGRIQTVYTPPGGDGKLTQYTLILNADKCPKEYQPDRRFFARGDTLVPRETATPTKKAAPAKKVQKTARVIKEQKPKGDAPEKVTGRARVPAADQLPAEGLAPEFKTAEN